MTSTVSLAFDRLAADGEPREPSDGRIRAPIIILHGLFGSARNWHSIAKRLSRSRVVYALDLRNHGRSPHAPAMHYHDLCADVIAFMDAEAIESACLLGHSMGGKTAIEIALSHPERTAHLIVVDIAPVAYQHSYADLLAAMRALPLATIKRRAEADQALRAALGDDDMRLFILQNLVFSRIEQPRWRINLEALQDGIDHLVRHRAELNERSYEGPVDVIRGENSDYVGDVHLPRFAALFPQYELHTIEAAGHWPHAQNPEGFFACLQQVLNAGAGPDPG